MNKATEGQGVQMSPDEVLLEVLGATWARVPGHLRLHFPTMWNPFVEERQTACVHEIPGVRSKEAWLIFHPFLGTPHCPQGKNFHHHFLFFWKFSIKYIGWLWVRKFEIHPCVGSGQSHFTTENQWVHERSLLPGKTSPCMWCPVLLAASELALEKMKRHSWL